jgi:hypothetical protein
MENINPTLSSIRKVNENYLLYNIFFKDINSYVFLYAENNDKNIIKKLEINKNIMNKIK